MSDCFLRRPDQRPSESLVSVIIPVFNTEFTLVERAVDSVVTQTYRDLEIILVDDGSEPVLGKALDALAARDLRIQVTHQPNKGVAAARNLGLSVANGDFACFLDADDYLMDYYLESALSIVLCRDVDAVFGGILVKREHGSAIWRAGTGPEVQLSIVERSEIEDLRSSILSDAPSPALNSKLHLATNATGALYSMSLISTKRFPGGVKHGEDRVFNVLVLQHAKRIAFCSAIWYVYDQTVPGGATRSLRRADPMELVQTIDAFAQVAGLDSRANAGKGVRTATLRSSAIQGIFQYVKVAVAALASSENRQVASSRVRELICRENVQTALRELRPTDLKDRIFVHMAKRRRFLALVTISRLYNHFADERA